MKLKGILIVSIILFSLIPVYLLYKYLQVKLRPRESGRRFLSWLLLVLLLVFVYTFLLVFAIKMLFPWA